MSILHNETKLLAETGPGGKPLHRPLPRIPQIRAVSPSFGNLKFSEVQVFGNQKYCEAQVFGN